MTELEARLAKACRELRNCLADVAAGKGGWDWEAVLMDADDVLETAEVLRELDS